MKNILIAIDSLYALNDSIISELLSLDEKYSLTFFCVADIGRESVIDYLRTLQEYHNRIKVIQVKRVKNFLEFIQSRFFIKKNFNNQTYIVLLGSNINIEEKILIHYLGKKSIYFGIMPTTPPGITYTARHSDKNRISRPQSGSSHKILDKSTKLIKFFVSIKEKTFLMLMFNSLFYRLTNFLKNLSIKLVNISIDSLNFQSDLTASRNGYINLRLAKAHFTPDDYWSYWISLEYPNEKVITYSNVRFSSSQNAIDKTKIDFSDCKVLLLGAYKIENLNHYATSITKLQEICKISRILIRPHPRFKETAVSLKSCLEMKFNKLDISLLCNNSSINAQIDENKINVVLGGWYSSVLNSIQRRNDLLILVDEVIFYCEFSDPGYSIESVQYYTGAMFGFNKEISYMGYNGNLYSYLPEKIMPFEQKESFSKVLNSELLKLEKNV